MNYKDLYFLSINGYLIDTEHVMTLEEYNQLDADLAYCTSLYCEKIGKCQQYIVLTGATSVVSSIPLLLFTKPSW